MPNARTIPCFWSAELAPRFNKSEITDEGEEGSHDQDECGDSDAYRARAVQEGDVVPREEVEHEGREVQEKNADHKASENFVERWRRSNDSGSVHEVHCGGDANGTKGRLKDNPVVERLVHDGHGSDGHALENRIQTHQCSRVRRAGDHQNQEKDQSSNEADTHHGREKHGVSGGEGQYGGNEGTQHGEAEEVADFSQTTVDGHSVVTGEVAPELLVQDRVAARISMSPLGPRSCFNVALKVRAEAPVLRSRWRVGPWSSLGPCTA